MARKTKPRLKAFSLIELSIVLLIASILITGALTVTKTSVKVSNTRITQDRINVIYKAMTAFLAANKRLPCPADITAIGNQSSTFGSESSTPGTCSGTGVYTSSVSNVNLVYGAVPTAALRLPSEYAADGFGTKFSYIVDKRFTKQSSRTNDSDGFEITPGNPQGTTVLNASPNPALLINVKDGSASGTNATTIGIFAIISHGANKSGGYNYNSGTQNTQPNSASDEYKNIYSSAANFGNILVNSSTITTYTFDDILLYKTKLQLLVDAGMEFSICSTNESKLSSGSGGNTLSWDNSYYGVTSNSTVSCVTPPATNPSRTCGKYGVWGTISNCTT